MKRSIITTIFIFAVIVVFAQEKATVYNPAADAKSDIKEATAKAKAENKHVLIQVGGNWCPWCIKFHQMATTDPKIDSLIKADYVYILLNYSKENKNFDVLKTFQNPQRFGFPVFLILDGTGKLLHTQDSGLLELDKGYDPKKVSTLLKQWNVKALDPKNYPEK
jgi:thioredoxin-related protein